MNLSTFSVLRKQRLDNNKTPASITICNIKTTRIINVSYVSVLSHLASKNGASTRKQIKDSDMALNTYERKMIPE